MIKVLIVDDEELFREGLNDAFEWEVQGFAPPAMAGDGIEALALVETVKPDIVLTDIRMPHMDGLEFIRRARELNPEIHFVIISGHDEFEYAQRAVKLGVADFLLKPFDDEDLGKTLLNLKGTILHRDRDLLEKEFHDVLVKKKNQSEFSEGRLPDEADNFIYTAMIVQIDDYYPLLREMYPDRQKEYNTLFFDTLQVLVNGTEGAVLVEGRGGECLLCFYSLQSEGLSGQVSEFSRRVRQKLTPEGGFSLTLALGKPGKGLEGLAESYSQAMEALSHKFLAGKNRDLHYRQPRIPENSGTDLDELDSLRILDALRKGDRQELTEGFAEVIRKIHQRGNDSLTYGLLIVGNLFSQALKIVSESKGSADEIFDNVMEEYRRITSRETVEEMIKELQGCFLDIREYLAFKRNGRYDLLIDQIKAHIRRNYRDYHLNLERVAGSFNISSGYLCALFNSYSDTTFKEYLTAFRIEKAKELMAVSDALVYEICYEVGYQNPTYFNSVFKKVTGMSPGQYRKQFSGLSD